MTVAQLTHAAFSAQVGQQLDTVEISLMSSVDEGPAKLFRPIQSWTVTTAQAGILVAELCSAIRSNQMTAMEFRTHGPESAVDDETPHNG